MNRQSLQALIIDHHFGELSPEDAKSLEARLAVDTEAQAEARQIRATLATAHRTVLMHPELVRLSEPAVERISVPANGNWSWLALAAAIVFLTVLSGSVGFWVGRSCSTTQATASSQDTSPIPKAAAPVENSPWTRYRIASNPGGAGLQIVRLENHKPNNTSIK